MKHVLMGKLLCPSTENLVERPRLCAEGDPQVLLVQAPAGFGKTAFLAQWRAARTTPVVFYRMDEQDEDAEAFSLHLVAGFRQVWSGWSPGPRAVEDPIVLATELVNEAIGRPPITLVLDQLESAFRQSYITDFLELLLRYAPPTLTLALGTRAPLPVAPELMARNVQHVTVRELAFTQAEATAWLGSGDWQACLRIASGCPAALRFWQQSPSGWLTAFAPFVLSNMAPHVPAELARALVDEWLAGRLSPGEFAHRVSESQPSSEKLWAEVQQARQMLLAGNCEEAHERLDQLWTTARTARNSSMMGAVALLLGERYYAVGEFGLALQWFNRAMAADPALETTGSHSVVPILLEQGHAAEAARLAQRCLEARHHRGDLQALVFGHIAMARVALAQGRLDEALDHCKEAERLGLQLSAEPFYGIFAMALRAAILQRQGQPKAARGVAEAAYALSRGHAPFLQSLCALVLGPILIAWGEWQAGLDRLESAVDCFVDRDAKWHAYQALAILARELWRKGLRDQARERFDQSLTLAVSQGYLHHLLDPYLDTLPLITDALVRGSHVPFTQELLIRIGDRALPDLSDIARHPDPAVRQRSLYPLVSVGGEHATSVIRSLFHDEHPDVQAAAMHAMPALGQADDHASAPGGQPGTVAPLSLSLLGPMQVAAGGQVITGWRTTKTRDLLAFLALHAGRPITRDQIMEALWPDASSQASQAVFHSSLYYLRRTLRSAGIAAITFAGGAYRLERHAVDSDLDRFHQALAARTEEGWRSAAALYRGDLLAGLDYPWCHGIRMRTRTLYLHALRSLAAHLRATSRTEEAIDWLQLLIQEEPLNEDAHVALMECYAAVGSRHAAMQQYRTMTQLLQDDLGLEPGDAAQGVFQQLLA